ncbi:hypothetical protein AWC38_SpisGene25702, partial [Stylophora pistillata]
NGAALTAGTDFTAGNVPAGLTMVVTKISATSAKITFTGKANKHLNNGGQNDSVIDVTITFNKAAFVNAPNISRIAGKSKNDIEIQYLYYAPAFKFYNNAGDRFFFESDSDDGSIANPLFIQCDNSRFIPATKVNGDGDKIYTLGTHFTVANLPRGLTVELQEDDRTQIQIVLKGKATAHSKADDNNNFTITLLPAILQGSPDLSQSPTRNLTIPIRFNVTVVSIGTNYVTMKPFDNVREIAANNGKFAVSQSTDFATGNAADNQTMQLLSSQELIAKPVKGTHFTVNGLPANLDIVFNRRFYTITFYLIGAAVNHASSDDTTFTITVNKSIFATAPSSDDDIVGRTQTFKLNFRD